MRDHALPTGTLLLTRRDIASLIDLGDCITAVEAAFRAHSLGNTLAPGLLNGAAPDGEFHIKAGGLTSPKAYYGLKANAGFFNNVERFGLPNIQGLILLFDAQNGFPLAVMDSGLITVLRTGAATAVAAKYLARRDSSVATICGTGTQGRAQLRALCRVRPLERAYAWSVDLEGAARFADEMREERGVDVEHARDLEPAIKASDVVVTCTPSRAAFLDRSFVRPGTFIATVGADSPGKQELDPRLLAENSVVVDLLDQCAHVGELQHAIRQGLMTPDDVLGELGDVIAGKVRGRATEDETIVFDSTGTALQDTAAAALAYERAVAQGKGQGLDFTAR
jgi:alanine dehydrogenase